MANKWYPKCKESLLQAEIDLVGDDIRVILIDRADYTYSDSHEFLSSVPSGARVAVSPTLTGVTVVNGLFDANDTSFASATGDQSEDLLIYQHTGSDATARLIVYYDTSIGNSPVTPSGSNINVTWNAGGIAQL